MAGRPSGSRNSVLCRDCGVDTVKVGEWYLVRDSLWRQAAPDAPGAVLCLSCIARQLGRPLVAKDFTASPASLQRRIVFKTF
jgi:hypothetical protein